MSREQEDEIGAPAIGDVHGRRARADAHGPEPPLAGDETADRLSR
ncbi:hypothetical protein [Actinomyces slackii]|nr:hypothetical protein [Actinomyces slackii]